MRNRTYSFVFSVLSCVLAANTVNSEESLASSDEWQEIHASYYAHAFHGRTTANCERFNMYGESAASKELRFGTVVRVRNPDNGREVTLRINDRGPYIEGRDIDLSLGAAQQLDMVEEGVARLQMQIISVPAEPEMGRYCS